MNTLALSRWGALALCALLLGGCAGLRQTAGGWLGLAPAPATVAGLDYVTQNRLGVADSACDELAAAWRGDRWLPNDQRAQLIARCGARVRRVLDVREQDQELDRLVSEAWDATIQARLERERRERRREQVRRAIAQAREEAEARNDSAAEDALAQLRERMADAHILQVLREVPDQPLAYAIGQPSERSMKEFLSCLEVAYPNEGYEMQWEGDNLSVRALNATMPRGDVDIDTQFVSVWNTWMLQSLSVAELRATNAQDRFMLAQNLVAGQCYDVDGRL
ncbi:hypothetical protein NR756_13405 [Alloalcanivorax xenomutans]|uniref:hypothetical protein n=1 Tax=Alloalcanivorax xenomutans TaxID=1094342 RepID=UPI003A805AB5